jgi:hypothetical protein
MDINVKSILNLFQKYEKNNFKEDKLENNKFSYEEKNIEFIKFKYSPQKVDYYTYKNSFYRREIDKNGNISWEIISGNIRNKIENEYHIKILEEKITKK